MKKYKKIILCDIAAIAIGGFAGFNVSLNSQNGLSGLTLTNVEILSFSEGGSSTDWYCYSEEKSGSGYYRCGSPCVWVQKRGGKGKSSKCYSN